MFYVSFFVVFGYIFIHAGLHTIFISQTADFNNEEVTGLPAVFMGIAAVVIGIGVVISG